MKKLLTLFAALCLCFIAVMSCDIEETPGVGGYDKDDVTANPWNASLNTAGEEETRTPGLATEGEATFTSWPPNWTIEISFPASQSDPGFLGLEGHGTVKETKWSQLEKDVVLEINKFRAAPVKWCKENGLPELDGISAYEEFWGSGPRRGNYNFPAQPVYPSAGLHKAALHQSLFGNVAHSDGSRVRVYVDYSGWGENVGPYSIKDQASGGATDAAKIVNEFIRDRGVAGKGHRVNIANPSWNRVGIACYNNLVIMQFGSGISEKNP
ncbi:MAG: hypothetical protein LBD20_07285 [Spirochaetaceae bacterium]|jgi:uncharacterized protein YkwD|nr:hypothetical protein [Spirochaetaceae bacterium]